MPAFTSSRIRSIGAVAGLVAITPAAGFVTPAASVVIGIALLLAAPWLAGSAFHDADMETALRLVALGLTGMVKALDEQRQAHATYDSLGV